MLLSSQRDNHLLLQISKARYNVPGLFLCCESGPEGRGSGPFYVVEFICCFDVKETSVNFSFGSVEFKVVF